MKIGILGCFYECAQTLPQALAPWRELKEKLKGGKHELVFAALNCQFTEYAKLGYVNNDEATRAVLSQNKDLFDWYYVSPEPLMDHEARTILLNQLLARGVDVVWIVDGDELYTLPEIEAILEFIKWHPTPDFFNINFKNYLFDGKQWMGGFCPPRIFRSNRHGGIDKFAWENELRYVDGRVTANVTGQNIPESVAHVKHLTWLNEGGEKKVKYQLEHYGYSSYRFNEQEKKLEFDPAYYAHFGIEMPHLFTEHEDELKDGLTVVLRTCDRTNVHPGKRCVEAPKQEIVVRCLRSLVKSMNMLPKAQLYIYDDHSSEEGLSRMKRELGYLRHPYSLETIRGTGNNDSMKVCFDKAAETKGLVYLVEDDYLHHPDALPSMLSAYVLFRAKLPGKEVALAPSDDPADYWRMDLCRIVAGPERPWRTNIHTTATMFVHSNAVREYKSLFDAMANEYGSNPEINEETTINRIWQSGQVVLFSPLPSLAFHIQEVPPHFEDWQKLWKENEIKSKS